MDLYNYNIKSPFIKNHLLSLEDYTADEIYQLISLALKLKEKKKKGIPHPILKGKTLGMIR